MSSSRTLGVGLLGAGPVTQAIHLPTLARLGDRFRVVSVMDVDPAVAGAVARGVDARPTTSADELLADPEVDVVAVCSPPGFHAEQVAAACAAGVRGILCEKPLATSGEEAEIIAGAVGRAATRLVVGAMHTYDAGWLAAVEACGARFGEVHAVRSTIVLPFNDRFESRATELTSRAAPPRSAGVGDLMRGMVLGLAVHDLPLVRAIAGPLEVDHARFVAPFGATLSMRDSGRRRYDLTAFMRPLWEPDWRLEAFADDWWMRVRFTPSYVHAGSATVEIGDRDGVTRLGPWPANGYEAEWVELHDQVAGEAAPRYDLAHVVDDLTFASAVAESAAVLAEPAAA